MPETDNFSSQNDPDESDVERAEASGKAQLPLHLVTTGVVYNTVDLFPDQRLDAVNTLGERAVAAVAKFAAAAELVGRGLNAVRSDLNGALPEHHRVANADRIYTNACNSAQAMAEQLNRIQ